MQAGVSASFDARAAVQQLAFGGSAGGAGPPHGSAGGAAPPHSSGPGAHPLGALAHLSPVSAGPGRPVAAAQRQAEAALAGARALGPDYAGVTNASIAADFPGLNAQAAAALSSGAVAPAGFSAAASHEGVVGGGAGRMGGGA